MCYYFEVGVMVFDLDMMMLVLVDGEMFGEIMFCGNICMKGYLKNLKVIDEVFYGGWFYIGDFVVLMLDGYIWIKDCKKDIIILGGENILSIEVEDVLYWYLVVVVVVVVVMFDLKWGEVLCVFVELCEGVSVIEVEIVVYCW